MFLGVILSREMTTSFQRSYSGSIQAVALPLGQKQNILLIEKYDLDADGWQLMLPSEYVIDHSPDGIKEEMHNELRELNL